MSQQQQPPAVQAYLKACRENGDNEPVAEFISALLSNDRECLLTGLARPLTDVDLICIGAALGERATTGGSNNSAIRCLSFEDNAFGIEGMLAIIRAVSRNPNTIRELRFGRNKLSDPSVIALANQLIGHGGTATTSAAGGGFGLKILDLSENGISDIGCAAMCAAIASPNSDLVEVSFHNNNLDADAGTTLSRAIRNAPKLKHLHLGYNQLKDAGATQLARCIPMAPILSTLDLTANRIGPQGGQELARALMTETCKLQRLNLRSNDFDDTTLRKFAEVISTNKSLTQLSLGHMSPSTETAAAVLGALSSPATAAGGGAEERLGSNNTTNNSTLLLLDIYGWKLDLNQCAPIIEDIMANNTTLRAITTDACQPIFHAIDKLNYERQQRGLHDIYIGPDDRLSAIAAETVLVPSPTSAVVGVPAAPPASTNDIGGPKPTGPSNAAASSSNSVGGGGSNNTKAPQQQQITNTKVVTTTSSQRANSRALTVVSNQQNDNQHSLRDIITPNKTNSAAIHNKGVATDVAAHLLLVLSQLQTKIDIQEAFHKQTTTALELRVKALEDLLGRKDEREQHLEQQVVALHRTVEHVTAQYSRMETIVQTLTSNMTTISSSVNELSHTVHTTNQTMNTMKSNVNTGGGKSGYGGGNKAAATNQASQQQQLRALSPPGNNPRLTASSGAQQQHQQATAQPKKAHISPAASPPNNAYQYEQQYEVPAAATVNHHAYNNSSATTNATSSSHANTLVVVEDSGAYEVAPREGYHHDMASPSPRPAHQQYGSGSNGNGMVLAGGYDSGKVPRKEGDATMKQGGAKAATNNSAYESNKYHTIARPAHVTPHRGPGTGRPATDFRDPYQDADEYYGNPTGRRSSTSPSRITAEIQLEHPSTIVTKDGKVDKCLQPNEPSPIHESSMPAPDLQASFQPPPTADILRSPTSTSQPRQVRAADLPRRKTPKATAVVDIPN